MCLIAFALNAHSEWPLILAANRDEFHDRPCAPAHWWDDHPGIYGGRDLSARGTWLGVSQRRRLAAITNFRESRDAPPPTPGPLPTRSRGELPTAFLSAVGTGAEWAEACEADLDRYAGFNALFFDWEPTGAIGACYLSNRHPHAALHPIAPGIHGLSNHLLGTRWPKVNRLCKVLTEALARPAQIESLLFAALADREPVQPHERHDADPETSHEILQRTPFVSDGRYGTRASTLVMVGANRQIRFIERSWDWHRDAPRLMAERRLEAVF